MMTTPQTIDDLKKEIDTTLSLADGERINICYALLKIVEKGSEKDRPELLRHTAESFDDAESSKEIKIEAFITQDERLQLKKRYGDLIDEMFELVLRDNLPEKEFYVSLWQVLNNPILRDEPARAFALYYILIDRRTPYFHLDQGLKMADDDWKGMMQRLRRPRAKVRFILATSFAQRSEEADLLVKELDALKAADRAGLMGSIIFQLRSETERVLRRASG